MPCPGKIFAVTPAEENVTWDGQLAVQDAIAKHLNAKYGIRTYQWLTEPLRPTLAIQADGWVFDAYCVTDPETFYAHIESFILTGLPVVPCLWASGKWGGWYTAQTWDALTRYTVERLDMCRAFELPVMVFAVDGPGSVGVWFKQSKTPGERYYRETIQHYLASVTNLPPASWRPKGKTWPAHASEEGIVKAKVDLKSFYLTDATTFDDIRNWRMEKEGLALRGERGTLSWNFKSVGKVAKGTFALRHSKGAKGAFCGVPLSADGLTVVPAEDFRSKLVVLDAEAPLHLEELTFEGKGEGGVQDVEFRMDTSYGRTDYTAKIVFSGEEKARLCGVAGHAATQRVVRRVPLPGHVNGRLLLEADVLADAKNYAGAVTMSVLSENGDVLASVASDPAKDARQTLRLTDDPPDTPIFKQGFALPYGTQVVDIVFDLRVGCGIETPGKTGAKVFSATLKYRPLHP